MNPLFVIQALIFFEIILILYSGFRVLLSKRKTINDKKLLNILLFGTFFSGSIFGINHYLYLRDLEFEANQGTKIDAAVASISFNISYLVVEYILFIISFVILIYWLKKKIFIHIQP